MTIQCSTFFLFLFLIQSSQTLASSLRGKDKGFVGAMASAGGAAMGIGFAKGRGRGRGRAKMYYGPDEFDDSWWTPPPPVGADPVSFGVVVVGNF